MNFTITFKKKKKTSFSNIICVRLEENQNANIECNDFVLLH